MSDFDYFAHDDRSHFERMLAGLPYVANAEHEAANRQAMALAIQYERDYLENPERAQQTLQRLCGELGPEVTVRPPLRVDYGVNLHLGERTFINYGLTALDVARISIGANCQIGPNVQLLTPTHALEPIPRAAGVESAAPIIIGRNVGWCRHWRVIATTNCRGDDIRYLCVAPRARSTRTAAANAYHSLNSGGARCAPPRTWLRVP
nr:maltose acetyltransferase domain-containing protein [Pseudoclavibacter sp. Marseille-Q3772]